MLDVHSTYNNFITKDEFNEFVAGWIFDNKKYLYKIARSSSFVLTSDAFSEFLVEINTSGYELWCKNTWKILVVIRNMFLFFIKTQKRKHITLTKHFKEVYLDDTTINSSRVLRPKQTNGRVGRRRDFIVDDKFVGSMLGKKRIRNGIDELTYRKIFDELEQLSHGYVIRSKEFYKCNTLRSIFKSYNAFRMALSRTNLGR